MQNIFIKSYTSAQRAKEILGRRGIRLSVTRGVKRGAGCGFVLRLPQRLPREFSEGAAKVCDLLRQNGISCDIS